MKSIRTMLAAALVAVSMPSWAQELLPPNVAFQVQAKQVSSTEIVFAYQIAPGYVLYKDRFTMIMSGGNAKVADVIIPNGEIKYDKAMKQDMEMYRNQVTVRVKIKPGQGTQGTLIATAQGCATEQGVCYPPINKAWSIGPVNVDSLMSNHAAACAGKDLHFSSKNAGNDSC